MAEDVKALSAELAKDPGSLVFLRLGELLRQRGQLDAAHRVAVSGLERHPHLADGHDLFARILADKRDYERAFDEWDMALRIAPAHVGALKGLAFLYFKVGDVAQAAAHLEAAQREAPDDPSITQAVALVQGGDAAAAARGLGFEREPPGPTRSAAAQAGASGSGSNAPLDEARVFAGLEGAQEGLLLLDASGQVLGGALRDGTGKDVTAPVAAYLAGVSQESARTAKLVGLGTWTGLAAEGVQGHVHLAQPSAQTLLLVARDRAVPMGRLAIIAQRAAQAAARWLGAAGVSAYARALDLITRVRGVRGAMLVSASDGLVVAEQLMEGIKGPAVAALAGSLANRLGRAMTAAGIGATLFWHLQCTNGALLVVPAPSGVLIVAVADVEVNVGLVRLELLRAAELVG